MKKPSFHLVAAALFAFASSCAGCFGCNTSPVEATGSNLPSACQSTDPLIEPQKLDVLFVIDNSNSMREEQEGVARELTAFIDELKKGGGVTQDFQVGVITTAVYQHFKSGAIEDIRNFPSQSGRLQPVPDSDGDGGVVLGTGTERVLNAKDAALVEKFARLVQQGTRGSGQETPFEAMRLAFTDLDKVALDLGGNGGFLRDGARLLVVVITDEDDCSEKARPSIVTVGANPLVDDCHDQELSLTPVSEYHRIFTQELRDSKGSSRPVIYTAIAPVARTNKAAMSVVEGGQVRNIDCPTSNEPGFRHRQMAEMFDTSLINLDSICRDSYRETLLAIAALANIQQTLDIRNVPDPRMLQIALTRKDGTVQVCTLSKGLEKYEEPHDNLPGRIFFASDCKRRSDDLKIEVKMLCVN